MLKYMEHGYEIKFFVSLIFGKGDMLTDIPCSLLYLHKEYWLQPLCIKPLFLSKINHYLTRHLGRLHLWGEVYLIAKIVVRQHYQTVNMLWFRLVYTCRISILRFIKFLCILERYRIHKLNRNLRK